MTTATTLSRRAPRRFWGWGQLDATLDAREQATVKTMVEQLDVPYQERPVPQVHEFALLAPRVAAPPALAECFSATPLDRLNHCVGKSFADLARMWLRNAPTWMTWWSPPGWSRPLVSCRHAACPAPVRGQRQTGWCWALSPLITRCRRGWNARWSWCVTTAESTTWKP